MGNNVTQGASLDHQDELVILMMMLMIVIGDDGKI